MNTGRLYTGLILPALVILVFSCATPKPVLYDKEGQPLSITEYEKIALSEYENDRFENAIEVYKAIVSHYPDSTRALAWANYEIGYCYWRLKDYENAGVYFRKVMNEFQEPAVKILAGQMLEKIEEEQEKK
ncbi:MAG: tetratricopeptide repeat protein [Spirochaetes bacterium]|nr:tetratricopeptide repeat protein [Spirochaetota bacterium]